MKWMEPFLEDGQLAGKIVCPNKKCGAKLGNYDWAGVCCSCKEWVTPVRLSVLCPCNSFLPLDLIHSLSICICGRQGFCIHRSKVDEVV